MTTHTPWPPIQPEGREPDDVTRHGCDWPTGKFSFIDEPGEHDPCHVVMPGGAMLALNHHAETGVDIARAKFIVAACNAALSRPSASITPRRGNAPLHGRPIDENGAIRFDEPITRLDSPDAEISNPHEAPEWLWYGEVNGVDVVTFGRWPKRGAKWRYKWAEIQPTEHDHPKTSRQAFEEILSSLHYDGASSDSLTVGEIRRSL